MKFCEVCEEEIATKDGNNRCGRCEYIDSIRSENKRRKQNAKARANRKAREEVLRDLGLVKVKGALGGTYWE